MAATETRHERVIPGVGTLEAIQEPKREYWLLPEGGQRRRRLPSVTQIINGSIPKPGLVKWAARLGPAYERARDQAAERGRWIHAFVEQYMQTGELLEDEPEDCRPYLPGIAGFLWEHDPKPLAIELIVCHPELGYAGRLDLIAEIAGVATLLDFKTNAAGRVYTEAHVQNCAYRAANERCGGVEIERGLLVGIDDQGAYNMIEAVDASKVWGASLALYGELQRFERGNP